MLKVGLVGYGFMGHMHAQCYTASGDAKVVALCDIDPEKRKEAEDKYSAKTFDNIEAMLNECELDIVDVCVPTFLHEEMVVKAAKKVKNIMCEKPMSTSVEACENMINACKENDVILMFGQVIRFWPEYQVIKGFVDSKEFGDVQYISAQRRSPFPTSWENWYADEAKSGGGALDLHIHDIDYINYIFGKPKAVFAQGTPGPGTGINGINTQLIYGDGKRAAAEGILHLKKAFPFVMTLLVQFDKASIKLDTSAETTLVVYKEDGSEYIPELPKVEVGKSTETSGNISDLGGYFLELKYFIDCVKAGKKPEILTPEDAMLAVKVCLAAIKSAKNNGEIVNL